MPYKRVIKTNSNIGANTPTDSQNTTAAITVISIPPK